MHGGQTFSSIPQVLGRLRHVPKPPFTLGLVAWEAYSDWVISPSLVAGLLPLGFPFICTDFPCILGPFYHWLPPCYNIEIGHPVFDRIELNPIP